MNIRRYGLPIVLALLQGSVCATQISGIDSSGFDPSVRIQDDLYRAVNGNWDKNTQIPADSESYGVFRQLRNLNERRSHDLILQATGDPAAADDVRKMTRLFHSYMQEPLLQRLGITPLRPELQQLAALSDPAALVRVLGALQSSPAEVPLHVSVAPAADNATQNLLQLEQNGLGMPDRDYYLVNDPRFTAARQAYASYLQQLLKLAGFSNVEARVRGILDLEQRIAQIQQDKVSNRDPQRTWNPLSRQRLQQIAPEIDWTAFFAAAHLSDVARLNVLQPNYFVQLAKLTQTVPLPVWRDYLNARLLDAYAPFLSKPFVDAHFAYAQHALGGVEVPKPRWKTGVALVETTMGETLGRLYVKQYFPPEAKARMDGLVQNLMQAYRQSIDTLPWMTPATREAARQKLAKYRVKIGYPSHWRDYAALTIRDDDLVGNVRRASTFHYKEQLAKLGQPVDREEWEMTPQTVNAYYEPTKNEIVFPAGILQAPFFNLQADDAVNYGAIGAIIGHEISHGFDDEGSQYDGDGNLRNWWSASDRSRFKALTDKLVEQYARYEPLPGHFVNGRLTLGENIADNAGLQIAYKAYHLSLGGRPAPVLDQLSGDQRFFIGFAQSWRSKIKDEAQLRLLVTDPHTPGKLRPLGAAVNADGFHEAFGTRPGDRMYKPVEERIRLW